MNLTTTNCLQQCDSLSLITCSLRRLHKLSNR